MNILNNMIIFLYDFYYTEKGKIDYNTKKKGCKLLIISKNQQFVNMQNELIVNTENYCYSSGLFVSLYIRFFLCIPSIIFNLNMFFYEIIGVVMKYMNSELEQKLKILYKVEETKKTVELYEKILIKLCSFFEGSFLSISLENNTGNRIKKKKGKNIDSGFVCYCNYENHHHWDSIKLKKSNECFQPRAGLLNIDDKKYIIIVNFKNTHEKEQIHLYFDKCTMYMKDINCVGIAGDFLINIDNNINKLVSRYFHGYDYKFKESYGIFYKKTHCASVKIENINDKPNIFVNVYKNEIVLNETKVKQC